MRHPAQALAWQMWRRGRVIVACLLVFCLCMAGMVRYYLEVFRLELSGPLPLPYFFVALMLGVAASFPTRPEKAGYFIQPWYLTLPVRTEALVGWPMLYTMTAVAIGWFVWVGLILRPSNNAAPLVWPALLFAAIVAWFQVLTLPAAKSGRRLLQCGMVMGLAAMGGALLIERSSTGPETPFQLSWAKAVSEPVLAALFAALIPAAYAAGVTDLARLRRGDRPELPELIFLDSPWLARWLSPRRTRAFASRAAAQFWFDWHEHGTILPFCWAGIQVMLGLMAVIGVIAIHVFGAEDDTGDLRPNLWWMCPMIFGYFAMLLGVLSGCAFKYRDFDARPEVALPPFTAVRPMAVGDLVIARLKVITLSVFITWVLIIGESTLLFLAFDSQPGLTAVLTRAFPEPHSFDTAAFLGIVGLALFVWLWKQPAEFLCFGFLGRGWLVLGGFALHASLAFAMLIGAIQLVEHHPELLLGWLREPPEWLIGLVGSAVLLKLLAAGWAIRAIRQRQLLSTRQLLGLLALWLLAGTALFALLAGLLPAGLIPWPWLACGVALALPLARITFAPLALAWNRHR